MAALATQVACSSGAAPDLGTIPDQVAQVGTEFRLELNGTDPDGDRLSYNFASADVMSPMATITRSPSGSGVFRWTPLAADVGETHWDFKVSDGSNDSTTPVTITVRSAIGDATIPIFRQPQGSGTTLNLAIHDCLDLDVAVEDQDTADVDLGIQEPPDGMTIESQSGVTATVHWCPTREQAADKQFPIVLTADDHDNTVVTKDYLVVVRDGDGSNCPGAPPVIAHTPQNANTIGGLTVDATVTDDMGLKDAPLFYYSLTNPGATPDLGPTGPMTQLNTIKISGTATNAIYAADVPNPVASDPAGTSKVIYYLFVADDDDDSMGSCDHSTQSQVYQMTVTSSGPIDQPICSACTSDQQCGTGDLCAYVGSMGGTYCLQKCGSACPSGYTCSAGNIYSVDGNMAPQCVPINGSCTAPNAACEDDANEDDDTMSQASANGVADGLFTSGFVSATLCPKPIQPPSGSKADDDWRQLKLTKDTIVDLYLSGGGESDIDLVLYNSSGGLVSKSTTLGFEEEIAQKCLKPGTYYVKINGFDNARTDYLLSYTPDDPPGGSCSTCTDDSLEDDNTFGQARIPSAFPYSSTGNKICPNNDDWFKVTAAAGKKIVTDLTFTQTDSSGDLDVHLYDADGFTDEWPCSVADPSGCSPDHGQGASSNEHAEFTVTTAGTYYVVIRGYNGSTNSYGISIKVQ
ncbi:MAG TPA: pre-peptidase C-terminal domain-containing protein [Kofleriaceae bacterium]